VDTFCSEGPDTSDQRDLRDSNRIIVGTFSSVGTLSSSLQRQKLRSRPLFPCGHSLGFPSRRYPILVYRRLLHILRFAWQLPSSSFTLGEIRVVARFSYSVVRDSANSRVLVMVRFLLRHRLIRAGDDVSPDGCGIPVAQFFVEGNHAKLFQQALQDNIEPLVTL